MWLVIGFFGVVFLLMVILSLLFAILNFFADKESQYLRDMSDRGNDI